MTSELTQERKEQLAQLRAELGVEVSDDLLHLALIHRSFAYEQGGIAHNERLEFLGDSVLGIIVTDELYRRFPELAEGQLAKIRAAVVNARALANVARAIGLGSFILLGRGEVTTGGHDKSSILADSMEAVIGAMYLSQGLQGAGDFVHRIFDPLITASADHGLPEYVVEDSGPDHEKEFAARVIIGGQVLGTGVGRSKKIAEQQAAEAAYRALINHA
jgi:ribonuclease-3